MELKFNPFLILYFSRRSTMELSEVDGDVNLDDIDSESRIEANRKKFQCDVCNKNLSTKRTLKVHKTKHTNQCGVCNMNFSTKRILKIHLREQHMGGKPYTCEFCEKTFTEAGSLKKHRIIHTGEKLYKCEICEKTFTQASALKTHRRIHTGEKPYACEICGKSFNLNSNLLRHKRIHTGENREVIKHAIDAIEAIDAIDAIIK